MPRKYNKLQSDAKDLTYKSLCPCCPYDAGMSAGKSGQVANSHNVRRHVKKVHEEIPWDYVDAGSYSLIQITSTKAVKYNTISKTYAHGFCFACGSYIHCTLSNVDSKLAFIRAHTCAEPKSRETKPKVPTATTDEVVVGEVKKTSVSTARMSDDRLIALFDKLKMAKEFHYSDMTVDIEKTLRLNCTSGGNTLWEKLKADERLKPLGLAKEEDEMREGYADAKDNDDDSDDEVKPFSPEAVIAPLLLTAMKAEAAKISSQNKINSLRKEIQAKDDDIETLKTEHSEALSVMESQLKYMAERLAHYEGMEAARAEEAMTMPEIVITEVSPADLPLDSSECVPIQQKAGSDGYDTQ